MCSGGGGAHRWGGCGGGDGLRGGVGGEVGTAGCGGGGGGGGDGAGDNQYIVRSARFLRMVVGNWEDRVDCCW